MSSSSKTLYADRLEWADVTPIPQYEANANPVAPIFYTPEYKDATDYFRGIVKTGEKSERVLDLTLSIIHMNPAHYSVWQYRYETLLAINASLEDELRLMDEIATIHLKTYQVWHHRRLLITKVRKPKAELAFVAIGLLEDAKNYHTWAYRQWILAHFNEDELWSGEYRFIENMLGDDVRNNSAWHHRFFVVFQSGVRKGEEDRGEVLRRELDYVKEKIALAPNNASAWNYLRGVLDFTNTPYSELANFVRLYSVAYPLTGDEETGLIDLENPGPTVGASLPCSAAIEFLADIYETEGGEGAKKATELWRSLADRHDPVRKRFWEHRIQTIQAN